MTRPTPERLAGIPGDDIGCLYCNRRITLLCADGKHFIALENARGEIDLGVVEIETLRAQLAECKEAMMAVWSSSAIDAPAWATLGRLLAKLEAP